MVVIWPAKNVQMRSGCTVFAGATRGPQALLCDSTVSRSAEARKGASKHWHPALTFCVHSYASRIPFLRVQVKSYYPLYDCPSKALQTGH